MWPAALAAWRCCSTCLPTPLVLRAHCHDKATLLVTIFVTYVTVPRHETTLFDCGKNLRKSAITTLTLTNEKLDSITANIRITGTRYHTKAPLLDAPAYKMVRQAC
jgi:hypothetical protein